MRRNTYVPGVFDVVHDGGRSTGFYATKDKFNFLIRSWNANNQPVSTKYLPYAQKAGARVVVVNPFREPALARSANKLREQRPSNPCAPSGDWPLAPSP